MTRIRLTLAVLLMVVLAVLATACGNGGSDAPAEPDAAASDTQASADTPEADEDAAEQPADDAADAETADAETEDSDAGSNDAAADDAAAGEADSDDADAGDAEGDDAEGDEPDAGDSDADTDAADADANAETAGPVAPIQVESETFVGDIIDNKNPTHVTLSTSGAQLVWPQAEGRFWNREGELCVYTFDSAATACAIAPDTFHGYPYAFFWSPDDRYVAFTENPIQQGNESDIWIFEPETETYTNLTDDGVEGGWIGGEPGTYALDYLPMWNEQDGAVYFWRSIPNPDFPLSLTLSIMRVTPEIGEPELVRDLQDMRGGELIWFDDEAWFMDGVSALSPDSRHVAVLATREVSESGLNAGDGLWLIDLADESAPPRHLVTAEDFQAALPAWSSFPLVPSGLSWQADGQELVVLAQNNDQQVPVTVLYSVSLADGALTPVVDFSTVPDMETYMGSADADEIPYRAYSPWTASMGPDNRTILMYQDVAGVSGLMASPVPPSGALPTLDYPTQLQEGLSTPRSSRSKDGKVLLFNILFNLAVE